MRSRALVLLVASSALGACSVLFDPRGYAEGDRAADGGSPEGGSPTASASAVPDAGAVVEADASVDGGTFCTLQPAGATRFCADFDQQPSVAGLGALTVSGGTVDFTAGFDSTGGLRTIASGEGGRAFVKRSLDTTLSEVTLSWSMKVVEWSTNYAQLEQIVFEQPNALCLVRLVGTATDWAVLQACYDGSGEHGKALVTVSSQRVLGDWHSFVLKASVAERRIWLSIDDEQSTIVMSPEFATGPTAVVLGAELITDGAVTLVHDRFLVTTP